MSKTADTAARTAYATTAYLQDGTERTTIRAAKKGAEAVLDTEKRDPQVDRVVIASTKTGYVVKDWTRPEVSDTAPIEIVALEGPAPKKARAPRRSRGLVLSAPERLTLVTDTPADEEVSPRQQAVEAAASKVAPAVEKGKTRKVSRGVFATSDADGMTVHVSCHVYGPGKGWALVDGATGATLCSGRTWRTMGPAVAHANGAPVAALEAEKWERTEDGKDWQPVVARTDEEQAALDAEATAALEDLGKRSRARRTV